MNKTLRLIAWVLLCAGYASAAENNPRAAYRYAPDALWEMDLASDTAWTLSIDGGRPRPIKVPGGGWNSDLQTPPIQVLKDVKDFVLYERKLVMPAEAAGQAVELRFGAVNYGCEVFLDGKKVGEHHGPQVAFTVDLTAAAVAGKEQTLQVKAFHRRHYNRGPLVDNHGQKLASAEVPVGFDFPGGSDPASIAEAKTLSGGYGGNTKLGYGIVRSIRLVVLPAVHVESTLVHTSVAKREFACDVWIRNVTDSARVIQVGAALSSWNRRAFNYPVVPSASVSVPAKGLAKVTLGPVAWTLGPESYWWPNIPFREDYLAQLHFLNVSLTEGNALRQQYPQRFGFVEHAEGPFYYTVNGVRVTGMSDATPEGGMSHYDAYATAAFLPPTGPGTGCPETWRRYLRIGININRLHCSPPTDTMMAAADEVGFMIVPEAPIWGNGFSHYNPEFTPQTYHDMGLACRNHPSVARYSLTNEVREPKNDPMKPWPWRPAIDDMREVDDTHPLVFDCQALGRVEGVRGGHAWFMWHYGQGFAQANAKTGILGMGECAWETDGMADFVRQTLAMRFKDWAYFAPWCWINFWPNFLEGMNAKLHAWKINDYGDRRDGVDGWGSPIVQTVQWALNPYLVIDRGLLELNPTIKENSKDGKVGWPYRLPVYAAGTKIERPIEVFNNSLSAGSFTVKWSAHWDSPAGPVVAQGAAGPLKIEAGYHATQTVTFEAPKPEAEERTLCLVLESVKDGERVMRDERSRLTVTSRALPASAATFIEMDKTTGAAWKGKYGQQGYWLAGSESKLPGDVKVDASNMVAKTWEKETSEPRVPAGEDGKRVAAGWLGTQRYLTFTLDVGDTPRKISLYFYIWKQADWTWQTVMIRSMEGRLLDERRIDHFKDGGYLSWKIKGRVQVEIHNIRVYDGFFSVLFVDQAGTMKID